MRPLLPAAIFAETFNGKRRKLEAAAVRALKIKLLARDELLRRMRVRDG